MKESAELHRDAITVVNLPSGRTAVLTFFVSNQGVDGVVLVEAPLRDVQQQVDAVERRLVIGGALAFGVALLAGALAAEPLARRLARLRAAADRIAHGSFDEPIVDHKRDEIGELARSLDEMRIAPRGARPRARALHRQRLARAAHAAHGARRLPRAAHGGRADRGRAQRVPRDDGRAGQRLTKLATDLLDLSRLDAGGFTVAHEELELGELAADCAREMQALASRRGSRRRGRPGVPALARGDEGRVLQVLRVLVDNAVRHTPPGSTVTLRTETTPWGASVIVSDNGPGIPPELLERVFERFYRGPGAAARGTGLGLAIARELAERMDGRLLASSGPGGTRFTLELPGPSRAPEDAPAYTGILVTTRAALASARHRARRGPRRRCAGPGAARRRRRRPQTTVTTVVQRWPPGGRAGGFDPVALYAGRQQRRRHDRVDFGVDDGRRAAASSSTRAAG